MKKSKLIRVLKTLSIEELKRFFMFLQSPYHNKNKKCVELMAIILPFAPNFDDDKLDDDSFLSAIYSNKNSIKTLLQLMMRLFEDFLAIEGLGKQNFYKKYLVLQQLLKRRELKHFNSIYKLTVDDFNTRTKKNLIDFYHRYLIATEYFQYQFSITDSHGPDYNELWLYMDQSYVLSRLKYTSSIVNRQRIKSKPMALPATDIMLQLANEKMLIANPLVKIYKTAYLLIFHNTEQYFTELLALMDENLDSLPKEDAGTLYNAAINFCIRQNLTGNTGYYEHIFNIYKICLEKRIFFVNNYLTPQRLHNLVVIGSKTGNFEWTENFLVTNKSFIEADFRELVFHYCKGVLYYNKGQLAKASDSLLEANIQRIPKNTSRSNVVKLYKINIQTLLLKIFFEEEETLAFDSLVKSFSERIRLTKDINQKEIKGYLNFISIINMLFKYKVDPNAKKTLDTISSKLSGYKHISNKKWLTTKIKELS